LKKKSFVAFSTLAQKLKCCYRSRSAENLNERKEKECSCHASHRSRSAENLNERKEKECSCHASHRSTLLCGLSFRRNSKSCICENHRKKQNANKATKVSATSRPALRTHLACQKPEHQKKNQIRKPAKNFFVLFLIDPLH
jgi:hypothetical protein